MGKRKEKAPVEAGSLERFVMRKVHRRELKNAPYNPRVINDDERGRLTKIIESHGIVAPTTWNKRTGNIVGGHQRTAICDSLYGTDDYEVTVSEIDVDEIRERELNLALNNGSAQGSYDLGLLEAMFRDTPTMQIQATGFDSAELFKLFGASPFEKRADDELSEVARKIREARDRQAGVKSKVKAREELDFYLVVIFKDDADRNDFTDSVGWDRNRYQSGIQLRMIAGQWIAEHQAQQPAPEPNAASVDPE